MSDVPELVLASGSKTRADMLERAGVPFHVIKARVDEDGVREALEAEGAPPREVADVLAEVKATQVSRGLVAEGGGNTLVIGADQILELDGQVFSKPADMDHAAAYLKLLRGKTHRLISGVCVARNGRVIWRKIDAAKLTMRPFSDDFLASYLSDIGEAALWSVGSYQIEGRGSQLFSEVKGDHFTILGMPLVPLLDFLRVQGVLES